MSSGGSVRGAAARGAQPRDAARGAAAPITPVGLHYLLIHYDIPAVDAATLAARDRRAASSGRCRCRWTTCARARRVERAVTMECAGNGRALLRAAAGSASRGCPRRSARPSGPACALAPLLEEAGLARRRRRGRLHRARPRHRGRRRAGLRSAACRSTEALASDVAARLRDERRAAAAAARLPAAAGRARLVRDGEREVAGADHASSTEPFDGYQQAHGYRVPRATRTTRATPVTRIVPRALMVPPGHPRLPRRASASSRPARCALDGPRLVGLGADRARRGQRRRRRDVGATAELGDRARPAAPGAAGASRGTPTPGEHVLCCRARDATGNVAAARRRPGTSAATRTTRSSASR